jgi:hypothetical protein
MVIRALWVLPEVGEMSPDHRILRVVPAPATKSPKITYYPPLKRLPDIAPAPGRGKPAPKHAKTEQFVRTNPPKAKLRDQFVYVPAPKIKLQPQLASPNLVLLAGAPPPLPPPPVRETPKAAPEPPAEVRPKLPLKRFTPPPNTSRAKVANPDTDPSAELVPDAPAIAVSGGLSDAVTAVILSAHPGAPGPFIPPEGNRPAKVEIGSTGGTAGHGSGAGGGAGAGNGTGPGGALVVPGVMMRGGGANVAGGVMAANPPAPLPPAPKPVPAAPPVYRPRLDTPSLSVPQWPNARRIPPPVEERFRTRVVYSTLVQPAGSRHDWVLWFGEAQPTPLGQRLVMRPPVAEKVSSPAGLDGANCWVMAHLNRDGKLSAISVSPDAGANRSAALAGEVEQWLFRPAIRNGAPVEVDIMIELEFARGR